MRRVGFAPDRRVIRLALIAASRGHFDEEEYQRQLEHGVGS